MTGEKAQKMVSLLLGRRFCPASAIGVFVAAALLALAPAAMARVKTAPTPTTCKDGMNLPAQALVMGGTDALQPDLLVTGVCKVAAAKKYFYGNVNIYGGGSLEFEQPATGIAGHRFLGELDHRRGERRADRRREARPMAPRASATSKAGF